ncbi:MAG: DUF1990 domain-containing protein [Kineosporiaceae bacterium]
MTFTYPEVGQSSAAQLPRGYSHLTARHLLAPGPADAADLARVGEALLTWRVHAAAGVRLDADAPRAAVGGLVTTRIGVGRARLSEPCRIVDVEESPTGVGFSYGTLPGHLFRGEERFAVERDADGRLWFTVRAFSVPAWAPARALWRPLMPVVALGQRGFARVLARGASRVLRGAA